MRIAVFRARYVGRRQTVGTQDKRLDTDRLGSAARPRLSSAVIEVSYFLVAEARTGAPEPNRESDFSYYGLEEMFADSRFCG